jgi:plastocyanin
VLLTGGLALTISGCSSDDETSADSTAPTTAPTTSQAANSTGDATETTSAPSDTTPADSSADLTLEGFEFSPAELTATPGQKLSVVNNDGSPHTVTLLDTSVDVEVSAGGSGEVVAPSEPGAYSMICEFHDSMTGTLTVSS